MFQYCPNDSSQKFRLFTGVWDSLTYIIICGFRSILALSSISTRIKGQKVREKNLLFIELHFNPDPGPKSENFLFVFNSNIAQAVLRSPKKLQYLVVVKTFNKENYDTKSRFKF